MSQEPSSILAGGSPRVVSPDDAAQRSLTPTILGLQRTLWVRGITEQKSVIIQISLVGLYAIGASVGLAFALAGDPGLIPLVAAFGVLVFWLFQGTMPSPEHHIDLHKLVSLPLVPRRLVPGVILSELLESRAMMAVATSIITAIGGSIGLASHHHGMVIPIYLVGIVVSFATAIVGTAAIRSLSTRFEGTSTNKQVIRVTIGMAAFFLLYLAFIGGTGGDSDQGFSLARFAPLSHIAAYLPFAAAVAPASSLADGAPLIAVLQAALAIAYLLGAYFLAAQSIKLEVQAVEATDATQHQKIKHGKRGFLMPGTSATPFGAIISRAYIYRLRDSRQQMAMVVLVLVAIFSLGLYKMNPESPAAWNGATLLLIFGTQASFNTFGYDGPNSWSIMVSGVPARVQLVAEALVSLAISAIVCTLYMIAYGVLSGFDGEWLVAAVQLASGLALVFGLSQVFSVFNAFPTSAPGTNPMKDKSGNSSNAIVTGFVGIFGILLPLIPGTVVSMVGLSSNGTSNPMFWIGLAISPIIAAIAMFIAMRITGKAVDERMPEIFQKVRSWV